MRLSKDYERRGKAARCGKGKQNSASPVTEEQIRHGKRPWSEANDGRPSVASKQIRTSAVEKGVATDEPAVVDVQARPQISHEQDMP